MEKREKKRRKKESGKRYRMLHILFGILSGAALIAALAGLVFILFYKAGQTSLAQAAQTEAPDAGKMMNAEDGEALREKTGLSTLQWEDNWVAIGDKVYAYDTDCVNLLFLGVDKPGNLDGETDFENWESGQTDAVFLVSLNPTGEKVSVVGIPRNSMVNIDIYDEENHKIDTVFDQICLQYAFAGGGQPGLERVEQSVSELCYGLPIHGAFAVGYGAVSVINDMAGGVDVEVLETFQTTKKKFVKGETLHLNGQLALAYVRGRNYGQPGSPTLRLQRQKQYLIALMDKVREEIKKDPMLVKDMYGAVSSYMNTDVTIDEVIYLAARSADYSFGENSFYLLQGEDKEVDIAKEDLRPGEEAEPFYDDYYLDEDSVKEVMLEVFYNEVMIEE